MPLALTFCLADKRQMTDGLSQPLFPATRAEGLAREDLSPDWMGRNFSRVIVAGGVDVGQSCSRGNAAAAFASTALDDAASRLSEAGLDVERTAELAAESIIAAAMKSKLGTVVTSYAPVGHTATVLDGLDRELAAAGLTLVRPRRSWDNVFWPHAMRGIRSCATPFRKRLPKRGSPPEAFA